MTWSPGEGGGGGVGGTREQKSRPKIPHGFQRNPKTIPGLKINPQKFHAEFLTIEILNIENIRN